MYDSFYKSFTDYNNDEANTDKFITKFEVTISDVSVLDTLYWQYDDGITAGVGAPTNLTASANLHTGAITVDWDAPANTYQYSPERYAIGFDKADPPMYAVATGNVGDSNALNTEYTFTKAYLQSALDAQVGDTLYFKIRSDNDTNSSYSSWTTIASYTIPDAPSGVTNVEITNNEYQGLKIGWVQPDTGWGTVSSYKISYKLSSEETYTYIENIDVNATSYLIEDIAGGTYDFVVYACSSTGWCHGGQAGPVTNYEVLSTTATTTTTTTTIPPTEEELNFAETGIYETNAERKAREEREAEAARIAAAIQWERDENFKETGIYETDAERREREAKEKEEAEEAARDAERAENKEKWDCYMTNAQIQRGDCEAYNTALYNSTTTTTTTTTTTIPEIKEDKVEDVIVEEEVKDETILEDDKTDITDDILDDTTLVVDDTKELKDEEIIEEEPIDDKPVEPIKEDFPDEEVGPEPIETDPIPSEEGDKEVQPTEVLVKETEAKVKELVVVEVIEDEPVEEFEAKVEEAVKELPKEKKVEVVKEVAKVSVQNLATADNTTKAVVKAVVKEVTKPETVAQLSEEEKVEVGKVLGFKDEETAAKDVEIIAEQATKEKNVATAVEEYVDRAIENKDVENYTLADVITEVQVEVFLENPVAALVDVNIGEMDWSSVGSDMTSDQKEKAQEVVVPVIIASQIISSAGALMTRRF
jgi:hypothetical protein